jgi:hypothetical protein
MGPSGSRCARAKALEDGHRIEFVGGTTAEWAGYTLLVVTTARNYEKRSKVSDYMNYGLSVDYSYH